MDGSGSSAGGRVLDSGLVAGHSYTITDVRRVRLSGVQGGPSCEVTLVRVRNPWGHKVAWNGPWSPQSQEWLGVRESERQAAGVVMRDEGEFWMSWFDFATHFDVLDLCHLRPGTLCGEARHLSNLCHVLQFSLPLPFFPLHHATREL